MIFCPLCKGINFSSAETLLYSLISLATQCIACPLCSDVLRGFDKFTLHLCSHILKCDSSVINLNNDVNITNINERFESIHLNKPVDLQPKPYSNTKHLRQEIGEKKFQLVSSHEFPFSSKTFENMRNNFSCILTEPGDNSNELLCSLVLNDKEPNIEFDEYLTDNNSKVSDARGDHNYLNSMICVDNVENTNNLLMKTNETNNFQIDEFIAEGSATRLKVEENRVQNVENVSNYVMTEELSVKTSDSTLVLAANVSDTCIDSIIKEPDVRIRPITEELLVQSMLIENYIQHSTEHNFFLGDVDIEQNTEDPNLHRPYSRKEDGDFITGFKLRYRTDTATLPVDFPLQKLSEKLLSEHIVSKSFDSDAGLKLKSNVFDAILRKLNLNLNSDLPARGTDKIYTEEIRTEVNNTRRNTLEDNLPNKNSSVSMSEYSSSRNLAHQGVNCTICLVSLPDDNVMALHNELVHAKDAVQRRAKIKGGALYRQKIPYCTGKSAQVSTKEQNDESIQYFCDVCFKIFKKEYYLHRHMKTHDDKQWACDDCEKLFATKYSLQKHKRLHTGEMPYVCPVCDKQYTFQQSYQKHLSYHSNEKPYTCKECCRSFKELSTLYNHQRIHTGEKPYSCDICGKKFRQRVACLVHKRIHTGTKPYECTKCHTSFRYKVSLKEHKCVPQTKIVIQN